MSKRLISGIAAVAIVCSAFAAGFYLPRDDDFFAIRKNFQIFGAMYEELVAGYVDDVDAERLMRAGIDAMLARLDPYTTFLDEADHAEMEIMSRGRYGGVGLTVGERDGRVTVIAPIEGTSGFRQGVRAGDVVLSVDGRSTDGMTPADVRNMLQGEPGTIVEMDVERFGADAPIQFALQREQVRIHDVSYAGFVLDDTSRGIGYIKLDRFGHESAKEFRAALENLQQSGQLRSLVIDMRDNPGGLLDAAVEITQLFIPQGSTVVTTRGRGSSTDITYRSQQPPIAEDLPLAVVVNEHSASASEIIAGAMQDLDRGVVVGRTTFGKGLVQVVRRLPYNTAVKLTTMRYYTPSGRSIQSLDYSMQDGGAVHRPDSLRRVFHSAAGRAVRDGAGIEPDVPVGNPEQSELEQALERQAAYFMYANHYAARNASLPDGYVVTDAELNDFRTWLAETGFSYRTTAEVAADNLGEELASQNYSSAADEIAELKAAIAADKQRDFDRYDETIRVNLRQEIVARFLSSSDRIRDSFEHDAHITEAVRVLETAEYRGILTSRR